MSYYKVVSWHLKHSHCWVVSLQVFSLEFSTNALTIKADRNGSKRVLLVSVLRDSRSRENRSGWLCREKYAHHWRPTQNLYAFWVDYGVCRQRRAQPVQVPVPEKGRGWFFPICLIGYSKLISCVGNEQLLVQRTEKCRLLVCQRE